MYSRDVKMRFVALFIFIAVSYCQAETVEELIKMANQAGAPFTPWARSRLEDSGLWGVKRSNRSSDAVIINASKKSFRLTYDKCSSGVFSTGLLPEKKLANKTSIVYGIESSQDQHGVCCTLLYQDPKTGSFFSIMLDNPFYGDNDVNTTSSWDLKITSALGHGHNNQVRFMVSSSRRSGPHVMLRQRGESSVSQGKLKRSGNQFIKVSRSDSRVQTL